MMNRKLILSTIGFIPLFLFAGVASAARLEVLPQSGSFSVGDTVTFSIMLDTNGADASAVDVDGLNYNPALFDVFDAIGGAAGTQISPGNLFPTTVFNEVNESTGKIRFSQSAASGSPNPIVFRGTGVLATFSAKVIAAGTGIVSIDFTSGDTTDSNVADAVNSGVDLLTSVGNANLTLIQSSGSGTDTTPPVISGLASGNITATSATISWNTNEPATSQVDYGLSTSFTSSTGIDSILITSHSKTISGLAPNATYFYRIRSIDASGNLAESLPSNIRSFTTAAVVDNTPPNAISSINQGAVEAFSAAITWSAPSDLPGNGPVSEYDIRYSTSQITDANWGSATQVNGEPLPQNPNIIQTFTIPGLNPGTTYYIGIRSIDGAGNASAISTRTLTTKPAGTGGAGVDTIPPGTPSNVQVFGGPEQILLTWKNPNDSDFVRTIVVRKIGTPPSSAFDGVRIYEGVGEEFTDTNLESGKTYYYDFFAYDTSVNYSQSSGGFAFLGQLTEEEINKARGGTTDTSGTVSTPIGGQCSTVFGSGINITRWMTLGTKGEDVRSLQQYLNSLGIIVAESGPGSPGQETTFFGSLSEGAIRKFQCTKNIVCRGTVVSDGHGAVGPRTRNALRASGDITICTDAVASGGITITRWVTIGTEGDDVLALQRWLNQNGFSLASSGVGSPGQETNFFGNLSQDAIRRFQCSKGVVCSGDVESTGYGAIGPKTRAALRNG